MTTHPPKHPQHPQGPTPGHRDHDILHAVMLIDPGVSHAARGQLQPTPQAPQQRVQRVEARRDPAAAVGGSVA